MNDSENGKDLPADGFAEGYSRENAEAFGWSSISGQLHPARVALLQQYLVGRRVLDAGCGGGAYTDYVARNGFEATGTDYHSSFLDVAAERGYLGTFLPADITALPFPDNAFDTTFCFDVLEHVDDQAAIRELARVTRERLIVAVPRENTELGDYNLTFLHYRDRTHLRNYTDESLRALAETVGPRDVRIVPELPIPAPELVRFLTTLNQERARESLDALIAWDRWQAEDLRHAANEAGGGQITTPTVPVSGVRSRVKAWAVQDAFVQDTFRAEFEKSYAAAYEKVVQTLIETRLAQLRERLDAGFAAIIEQALFFADYRTIFTGLVVIIDL